MVSVQHIRNVCQREKLARFDGRGVIERSYAIHRYISTWLTWAFVNATPFVRPNHVSAAMIAIGLFGVFLLALPSTELSVYGVLLLYLSFLLDKVDGEIARFRNEYSRYGKLLDEIYHLAPQPLVYVALGIHVYGKTGNTLALMLGFVCHFGAVFRRVGPKFATIIAERFRETASAAASTDTSAGLPTRVVKRRSTGGILMAFVVRFDVRLATFLFALALEPALPMASGTEPAVVVLFVHACVWTFRAFGKNRRLRRELT